MRAPVALVSTSRKTINIHDQAPLPQAPSDQRISCPEERTVKGSGPLSRADTGGIESYWQAVPEITVRAAVFSTT